MGYLNITKLQKFIINNLAIILAITLIISPLYSHGAPLPIHLLQLPPGFSISIYANNVPYARHMALGDGGIVYVGTKADKVFALVPDKNYSKAKERGIVKKR